MSNEVHIYNLDKTTREKDTVLPPNAVVHAHSTAPRIVYAGVFDGELTVCVRGPFVVSRGDGASGRAYFLQHPPGHQKEAQDGLR